VCLLPWSMANFNACSQLALQIAAGCGQSHQ
jgi:hypothetical protein